MKSILVSLSIGALLLGGLSMVAAADDSRATHTVLAEFATTTT